MTSNIIHEYFILIQVRQDRSTKHPEVRPNRGLFSWPPDHDSAFHVTETPAPCSNHLAISDFFTYQLHTENSDISLSVLIPSQVYKELH